MTHLVTTKCCNTCGERLPVGDFRRRAKGHEARQGQCRACFAAATRVYRQARRAKRLRQFAASVRVARDILGVAALTSEMVRRFGGVEGLAAAWHSVFQAARPGSKESLASCQAVVNLIAICSRELPDPNEDLDDMSNEELEREIRRLVSEELAKQH